MHGASIQVPTHTDLEPRRDYLAERFDRFRKREI
jgi:hypothetical protein